MANQRDTAAPPFDAVPSPDDAPEAVAEKGSMLRRVKLPRGAWIALLVLAAGFGQGIGLALFFGGAHGRLSEPDAVSSEKEPSHESEAAADEASRPAASADAEPGLPRELKLARERLQVGDAAGARRMAADFLLRHDGLEYEETRFAVNAYALLADVLRSEYEKSLGEEPR